MLNKYSSFWGIFLNNATIEANTVNVEYYQILNSVFDRIQRNTLEIRLFNWPGRCFNLSQICKKSIQRGPHYYFMIIYGISLLEA